MESLRCKIMGLVGRGWVTQAVVQAAFADGLNIAGEDLSQKAQYYTERDTPVNGADQVVTMDSPPPKYILRRLTNAGMDLEKLIADAEATGQPLTMADVRLILDSFVESKTNIRNAREEKFSTPVSALRERINSGLFWEAKWEEGYGVSPAQADIATNMLRSLKARYVVGRVQAELGFAEGSMDDVEKKFFGEKPNVRFFHLHRISDNAKVAIEFKRNGAQRTFRGLRKFEGQWHEVSFINGIEFPFTEEARTKDDKTGRWVFTTTPSVIGLIAVLKSPVHVVRVKELYNELFEDIKSACKKSFEEEVSCTYVALDYEDMGNISFYGDDGEADMLDISPEPDFWVQELAENDSSPVDATWSEETTYRILSEMDPECVDHATRVCDSRWHVSIRQSLFWLMGGYSQRRKKWMRGFVSHSALTRGDREVLMEFGRRSWDYLNKIKELSEQEQARDEQSLMDALVGGEEPVEKKEEMVSEETVETEEVEVDDAHPFL